MLFHETPQSETYPWGGYAFTIHKVTDRWNHVGGIYVFASRRTILTWTGLYVGETDDFAERFSAHERWRDAASLGATHVHALVMPDREARAQLERLLITQYLPILNTQHRVGTLRDLLNR